MDPYRDRALKLFPWVCARCGERLEGQFAQCWNCGADRPAQGPGAG